MILKNLAPIHRDIFNESGHIDAGASMLSLNRLYNHLNMEFFDNAPYEYYLNPDQSNFPKIDVTETENEFLICAELPGIDGKDINVTLNDKTLTIEGEKRMGKEDRMKEQHSAERAYGSYSRSFQIPKMIDREKIDASCINGVLTIKLPKLPEIKKAVRKILINQ